MRFSSEAGQSTVEAAILLPMLFALFGLLLQPAILLYDRSIMNAAAGEGCRAATTCVSKADAQAFIERRLGAIPKIPIFHDGDEWEIEFSSNSIPYVRITNHVQPLPLFGIVAGLANAVDDQGRIEQVVISQESCVPAWTRGAKYAPSSWVGAWK